MIIQVSEYCVIQSDDVTLLVKKVNEWMSVGWVPHGSLVLGHHVYLQPMTRTRQKEQE